MSEQTPAHLEYQGHELELPVEAAVEGNDGLSIAPLLKTTGAVTYDPGFMNTANTKSAITYIDGDEGILRYRGYPIEQLAEKSNFLEVSYLLIYGELPTEQQLADFDNVTRRHTLLHEELKNFFSGFPATRTPCRCCPPRYPPCPPTTRTHWTRSTPTTSNAPPTGCWRSSHDCRLRL